MGFSHSSTGVSLGIFLRCCREVTPRPRVSLGIIIYFLFSIFIFSLFIFHRFFVFQAFSKSSSREFSLKILTGVVPGISTKVRPRIFFIFFIVFLQEFIPKIHPQDHSLHPSQNFCHSSYCNFLKKKTYK